MCQANPTRRNFYQNTPWPPLVYNRINKYICLLLSSIKYCALLAACLNLFAKLQILVYKKPHNNGLFCLWPLDLFKCALEWGSRGRRFKSSHPDQIHKISHYAYKSNGYLFALMEIKWNIYGFNRFIWLYLYFFVRF